MWNTISECTMPVTMPVTMGEMQCSIVCAAADVTGWRRRYDALVNQSRPSATFRLGANTNRLSLPHIFFRWPHALLSSCSV